MKYNSKIVRHALNVFDQAKCYGQRIPQSRTIEGTATIPFYGVVTGAEPTIVLCRPRFEGRGASRRTKPKKHAMHK